MLLKTSLAPWVWLSQCHRMHCGFLQSDSSVDRRAASLLDQKVRS